MKKFDTTTFFNQYFSIRKIHLLVLGVLCFFFFILGNNNFTLFDNSETHYARVSQEMANTGNYLTLTFNGEPWFVHPPLYFWMTQVTAPLFDWSPFGLRLQEGVFGFGVILLTYLLGQLFFSQSIGFTAALILATSLYFIVMARLAIFDTHFLFFTLLSTYCYLIGIEKTAYRHLAFLIAAISVVLAVLVKGPFGLIHPALMLIPFLAYKRRLSLLISKEFLLSLVLIFVLASPWYIYELSKLALLFLISRFGITPGIAFLAWWKAKQGLGIFIFAYCPHFFLGYFIYHRWLRNYQIGENSL